VTQDPWLLDLERTQRTDLPEAVYCGPKRVEECVAIVGELLARSSDAVVATRATSDQVQALLVLEPEQHSGSTLVWRPRPRTAANVLIVAGGTSDRPVVEECRLTLAALGHVAEVRLDVGVAGLHRLTGVLPQLRAADLVIAVAGMEAALVTVLSGLIAAPIVAVPASTGYGASLEGVTALLSMLASCAPGISVVGIDNGFGAAYAAHRMLRLAGRSGPAVHGGERA
jgi:pyridinium-3,5-biscarboxylic acid mononucleotide synthase